ncbi:MAG: transglutaminase domain-containing protein [Bacteroidota bacterium]
MITRILFFSLIMIMSNYAQNIIELVNKKIESGEFIEAQRIIDSSGNDFSLSEQEKLGLNFLNEKMDRIRLDFKKTESDMLEYISKYYPEVNSSDLKKWEDNGSLEYKIIDGEKFYFNRAHGNLFRVDKEAKSQKQKVDGNQKDKLDAFLEQHAPKVIEQVKSSNSNTVLPQKFRIKYTLTVDADVVPDGEVIKCWLPYPREGHKRQKDISLLTVNSEEYILADNKNMQRTLYIQKLASTGAPTEFLYSLEYTGLNEWYELNSSKVQTYDEESDLFMLYTSERLPHIQFTDKIKTLSAEIIGDETNPYLKAKKIYTWINDNIPWAGAREYSTLDNISDYCISKGYGDCGIQTLLFMTLCRYNGIPAKWQSGWMMHPGSLNLHDWSEIYFEGVGWVPVDQSFKCIDSSDENVKYFFLGGIDAFHFIVNDDYSAPLFPAKIFPRSETVDFQRGEVEWRGGNLYFDKWDYNMEVEYLFE